MLVPFSQLQDDARVWIYPSDRPFRSEELPLIKEQLEGFLDQWTAHQNALEASYELPYNRFIVLAVNQARGEASGCSIDASVRFIQSLEEQFEVALMDRMNVTFKQGAYLTHKSLLDFKALCKAGSVSKNTIVFNNLLDTKLDYDQHWEVPAAESWHSRFIKS
mgnify:FL=1